MLTIEKSKKLWIIGVLVGVCLYSSLNFLSYIESTPKLPLATKVGIFKSEKIGRMKEFFFFGGGVSGRCSLNICKKNLKNIAQSELMVVVLDIDGNIYSVKSKVGDKIVFTYEDANNEVLKYFKLALGGFFVIFMILMFLVLNRKNNGKY